MINSNDMDNFISADDNRVAIFSSIKNKWFEISSGSTVEEAKFRFYSRYLLRECDRMRMVIAQNHDVLHIMQCSANHHMKAIERNAKLIANELTFDSQLSK